MKIFFVVAVTLTLLSTGPVALAQVQQQVQNGQLQNSQFCQNGGCTYTALEPIPGLPNVYGPQQGFGGLVSGSFKLLIGAGAVVAVVMIVLGALTYMFSDIAGNKTKALSRIRGAMWAIVLLMSSYLILYTINPDLVNLTFVPSISNNYTVGANQMPPTRVPVFTDGTTIYNGPGAYDQLMGLQSRCESPKALHATSNGTDSTGGYVTYTCK